LPGARACCPARLNVLPANWESLLRVIIVGAVAYIALVLMPRVSGTRTRTLSKMNAPPV